MEHLGPTDVSAVATHTRIHLGMRAPAERRQVHPKDLANSNTGEAKMSIVPQGRSEASFPSLSRRQAPKVQFDKMVFVHLLFVTLFCPQFSCFTPLFVCFFQASVE